MKLALALVTLLAACNPAAEKAAAQAEARARKAEVERDEARKELQETREKFVQLSHDVEDVGAKLAAVVETLQTAEVDADRASAKAKLEQLKKEKAELEQRLRGGTGDARPRPRDGSPDKRCLDNPLAAGCS